MRIIKISISILLLCFPLGNIYCQEYLHQMINSNLNTEKPISYVGLSNNFNSLVSKRIIPLSDEEGGNGYVVEPNLAFRYALFSKRKTGNDLADQKIVPFFGYSRLYLDYSFHTRVVKGESSPILPPTNRFGLGYEKVFGLKKDGEKMNFSLISFKADSIANHTLKDKDVPYSFFKFESHYHHFSNGQGPGVYLFDSLEGAFNRNNYLTGDFSTNFWRFGLSHHFYIPNKIHQDIVLNYQVETGNDNGFLSFRKEQENRYGRRRINLISISSWALHHFNERNYHLFDQIDLRMELSTILDSNSDLFQFPYHKKYRTSFHLYAQLPLTPVPTFSIMLHYFRGRDYLNVRYDDPVSTFQLGLSVELFRNSLRFGDDESLQLR